MSARPHTPAPSEDDTFEVLLRFARADDLWSELVVILRERNALNQAAGGSERMFIIAIALLVSKFSLPVGRGDQQ